MPDAFAKNSHRIDQSCILKGGGCIPFSQSRDPVRSQIASMPRTQGGICQALAAKWIAEHANGGSLWTWLNYKPGGGVDRCKIGTLMIKAIEYNTASGYLANPTTTLHAGNADARLQEMDGLCYVDFVTTNYLDLCANLRRRKLPGNAVLAEHNLGHSLNTGRTLAQRLSPTDLFSPGGCYVLISVMSGPRTGHAMAAFVGQDIAFFDPNFGEYYFPPSGAGNQNGVFNQAFLDWFMYYWQASGYINRYGSFRLLSYGKRVSTMPYEWARRLA